jgi:hypothetical protein
MGGTSEGLCFQVCGHEGSCEKMHNRRNERETEGELGFFPWTAHSEMRGMMWRDLGLMTPALLSCSVRALPMWLETSGKRTEKRCPEEHLRGSSEPSEEVA